MKLYLEYTGTILTSVFTSPQDGRTTTEVDATPEELNNYLKLLGKIPKENE